MRLRTRSAPVERVPMGEVLIEARALEARRGGAIQLHGVDLRVRAGEVVAIVGPNGAGKSTLLAALSGDLPCSSGVVEVVGEPLASHPPAQLARRRAVLPQQVTVAFPFTVDEVVRMGRAPWSDTSGPGEDDLAVAAAMADCDVVGLADRPFPSLSGGEQARVSLARVLAQQAQLLLLDEPMAALDLRHQDQVFGVLRRRAQAGDGIVVVLHDLTAAAASADRVVLLDRGEVVADDSPERTLHPGLLAEVYEHRIDVFPNPVTGALTVVPQRPPPIVSPPTPVSPAARTGVP
jgi:iron complex transport system ATP-binding protein